MEQQNHEARSSDLALYQRLVDSVWDYAIFALDDTGRVISWNPGAEKIKGYTREEILGLHFSVFFTSADQETGRPNQLLARAASEGRVEDEAWRVRKDGSVFWANVVIAALHSPEGELLGFSKVTRDLTERVAAEQSLRLRERQLADAQALAGLGSWEWDVIHDRVSWSEELYRIYQLDPKTSPATFAGYLDRVHREDRERVRAEVENAYRTGASFEFEERIVRPDGSVRVLLSRGRALTDGTGAVIRLMGACLDITELREAQEKALGFAREQSAREAAEELVSKLRFLVESSELLASSLDYEATLRTIAELAVPSLADWCVVDLLEEDGSLGRLFVSHADPDRIELARQYAQKYPSRRDSDRGAWSVVRSGNTQYHPRITDEYLAGTIDDPQQLAELNALGISSTVIVPLIGHSEPLGALTLVQSDSGRTLKESDVWVARELGRQAGLAIENARFHYELLVKNRKLEVQSVELERQAEIREALLEALESKNRDLQQRTAEAEEANRAKSDFLAAMSHDLRTPLNAIYGYADLIQMGLHGPVTDRQFDAMERIKRNQRSLLSLVNDVLNYARLEAGKLEITITDVAVADVIDDLEAVTAPQIAAKGLRYRCPDVLPELIVRGERDRIEQVLFNLISNAIKFTPAEGEITVEVDADPTHVRFHVHDTGIGIDADRQRVIFDPFVQVDRAGDAEEQGVGLGLAISRNLARAMNGTLTVESTPGVGSVFTLTLPRGPLAGGKETNAGAAEVEPSIPG